MNNKTNKNRHDTEGSKDQLVHLTECTEATHPPLKKITKDLEKLRVNIKGTQNQLKSHTNTPTDTEKQRGAHYLKIDATNPFQPGNK